MALGAKVDNQLTRGHRRARDRRVGELGGDRQQMVFARTMTFLTADPVVRRSGPGPVENRLWIGDMAE